MGLDLTIYMAKRGARRTDNPFMPEPPVDHHWDCVAEWRKFYSLQQAIAPGAGSPEWRTLTREDIERVRQAMLTPEWHWPRLRDSHAAPDPDQVENFRAMLGRTLNIIEGHMQEGRVFLIEVLY